MFPDHIIITDISLVASYKNKGAAKRSFSARLANNELIFLISGENEVYFRDDILFDYENSIRFLPKDNREGLYEVHRKRSTSCIDIYFQTESPIDMSAFSTPVKNSTEMARLFRLAENTWRTKPAGYRYKCIGILYDILHLLQSESSYSANSAYQKIAPAVRMLQEHFTASFSMTVLAKKCNISYSYLKKLFYDVYQMSPKAYMMKLRMEYACELIRIQKHTLTEIAEMTGFENVYYFSRAFKKAVGVSPSVFKRDVHSVY